MKRRFSELERLACLVAIEAPWRAKSYNGTSYVRWDLIEAFREELENIKWDWRSTKKIMEKIEHDERKARRKANAR